MVTVYSPMCMSRQTWAICLGQYGATSHTAHTTLTSQALRVNVLPWPSKSPDLNLNEHTWDVIGRVVRRQGPVMFQQLVMDG